MNVPLSAKAISIKGKQKILIWRNGKSELIDPPFKPYFYSFKKIPTPARVSNVTKTRLSDGSESTFYKHEFHTTGEIPKYRIPGKTFEDNIPFINRVRANCPDFFTNYPNSDELRILQLDIEQYYPKEAFFPTFNDRITNIAYKLGIKSPVKRLAIKKETLTDKGLLEYFIRDFINYNPDIIEVYNKSYDITTIIHRMEHNNIPTTILTRDKSKPYIESGNIPKINGRIIYDLFDSVKGDQSLNGNVENRGLKAVSNYHGFKSKYEVVDFKVKKMDDLVGTQELKDYNEEDVHRLHMLHEIYFPNVLGTAEGLQLPLSACIDLKITDLGNTVMGELYHKHNIISDGKNQDKYPDIFNAITDGGKYQGALIGIKKQGLYKPIKHADFSSMYPKTMAEFNFSPETTKIVGYEPYNSNAFKVQEEKDHLIYYIPDNKINKTVIIQVGKAEGLTTKLIKQFLDNRANYKAQYKKTRERKYDSLSNIEKVKANGGIYGIQGSASHPFGHVPSAIATTGIARECIKLLIKTLETLYPNSVIEWDTDGVYFTTDKMNKKEILSLFDKLIHEKFNREIKLEIGFDSYDAGFFHVAKNYILQRGDIIILHGVAMKSSTKCNIERNLINELVRAKMSNKNIQKIINKYQLLSTFPLEDFVMSRTMGRVLKDYKSTSSLTYRLILKGQHLLNKKPIMGNKYYYIKTQQDYELYETVSTRKNPGIDYKYYSKKIKKIIEMFKSSFHINIPLSTFFGKKTETTDWDFDQIEASTEERHGTLSKFF